MKKIIGCCIALLLLSIFLSACGPPEPNADEQKKQAEKMKKLDERQ